MPRRPAGAADKSFRRFVWCWVVSHRSYRPFSIPTRYAGAIRTWRSTPTLPPATLRVAMRAGHHSARPDSRTTTTTRTRRRTKRLVSTFNPLRGCNSGKALLIGLTRLFCKQQRSSTSTSTNAERRTPNAKRLVSAETRARGSARLYDPHVDPAPDFMDWYCKLREGKLFFHE